MIMRSSTYFIGPEGIDGLKNFLWRREIRKEAEKFGIPFEKVQEELTRVRKENPGKGTVIVFSKKPNQPPLLLVEERDAHFERVLEQINRTGICTSTPI